MRKWIQLHSFVRVNGTWGRYEKAPLTVSVDAIAIYKPMSSPYDSLANCAILLKGSSLDDYLMVAETYDEISRKLEEAEE